MTGYTVHTGASKKFVSGWDRIFTGTPEADGAEKAPKKKSDGKKKKSSRKPKKKS